MALSGFVLHRDRLVGPSYDERHGMQVLGATGYLKGPLTPVLADGYQLTDGNSDVWAVLDVKTEQQQICTVRRTEAKVLGPDRGGAA